MEQMQLPAPIELDEIHQLSARVETAEVPDPQDVNRLRQLLDGLPDHLFPDNMPTGFHRHQLIEKMSRGATRVFMMAESDRLKQDLGFAAAPPTERLLIDHILTLRLHLFHAEKMYGNAVMDQATTPAVETYRDKLLTTAQNRYLRAIESLARVRRLASHTPSLQINIAREGGQQVNVQGEVSGQRVPQTAA